MTAVALPVPCKDHKRHSPQCPQCFAATAAEARDCAEWNERHERWAAEHRRATENIAITLRRDAALEKL
jgi:hypothetical protein